MVRHHIMTIVCKMLKKLKLSNQCNWRIVNVMHQCHELVITDAIQASRNQKFLQRNSWSRKDDPRFGFPAYFFKFPMCSLLEGRGGTQSAEGCGWFHSARISATQEEKDRLKVRRAEVFFHHTVDFLLQKLEQYILQDIFFSEVHFCLKSNFCPRTGRKRLSRFGNS